MKILLADDEKTIRVTLTDDLEDEGYEVTAVDSGDKALIKLEEEEFSCVITDIRMPGADGMQILAKAKEVNPDTEVIIITGYATIEDAVDAIKVGATDYIQKPFLNERVLGIINSINERKRLEREHLALKAETETLREKLGERYRFHNIIGKSAPMQKIYDLIKMVAPTDATVLIEGESGTGKELIANAVHYNSPRKDEPYVKLSCAAIPETLLEDQLFGHEKGAFTDAVTQKKGSFELADGGTIFLDDIDDMPGHTQVKLLRVLQEREFERVGGTRTLKINVRVVVATKKHLEEEVAEKRFREDLFYRLNVVKVRLPGLSDRIEDIPLLCDHFIKMYGRGNEFEIPAESLTKMLSFPWPGNIRELENSIERAVVLSGGSRILKEEHLMPAAASVDAAEFEDKLRPLADVLKEVEAIYIKNTLRRANYKKIETANILGISRKTLWEKIKTYSLKDKPGPDSNVE